MRPDPKVFSMYTPGKIFAKAEGDANDSRIVPVFLEQVIAKRSGQLDGDVAR